MRAVWVIQHDEAEPPALIRTVLERLDLALATVRPDQKPLPDKLPEECSALVLMGGPYGVYESDEQPWIVQELALLREAIDTARPVLGICLGAQLLASAGGANVYPADPPKEIGWHPIKLTPEGQRDPLSKFLANPLTGEPTSVFQWHGDTFDLPPGGIRLATSTRFPQQAFRLGRAAYGFQFHFEVTEEVIRHWVTLWRREMQDHEVTADDILSGLKEHLPLLNRRGEELVRAFAALIHASPMRELPAAPVHGQSGRPVHQRRIDPHPTGVDASNLAAVAAFRMQEDAQRLEHSRTPDESGPAAQEIGDGDPASRPHDASPAPDAPAAPSLRASRAAFQREIEPYRTGTDKYNPAAVAASRREKRRSGRRKLSEELRVTVKSAREEKTMRVVDISEQGALLQFVGAAVALTRSDTVVCQFSAAPGDASSLEPKTRHDDIVSARSRAASGDAPLLEVPGTVVRSEKKKGPKETVWNFGIDFPRMPPAQTERLQHLVKLRRPAGRPAE
ncbi:MAG: PilZ domain-containing protein [SAR324 cluster bacterium]